MEVTRVGVEFAVTREELKKILETMNNKDADNYFLLRIRVTDDTVPIATRFCKVCGEKHIKIREPDKDDEKLREKLPHHQDVI